MKDIIRNIRKDLKIASDKKYLNTFQRFFKEKVKCYGINSTNTVKLMKKYYPRISVMNKKDIFSICNELYSSNYCEEAFISTGWLSRLDNLYTMADLNIFRSWINKYIDNWAKCDGFCCGVISKYLDKYPSQIKQIIKWSLSENKWIRRASAVSLVTGARKGLYLKEVFTVSDILLEDNEDMVQKGYGWLLKEASRKNEDQIFKYILKNKDRMPRKSLRYAIELMDKDKKTIAMRK